MTRTNGNYVFIGGTHGIGKAAALALASQGANVMLVARDPRAGAAAVAEMRSAGAASAEFLAADLSTVAGMNSAGAEIAAWQPQLHGLMHSAMSAFGSKIVTADRLELAFALQYLARAVINRKLAGQLAASGDGRIVHVAGAVPHRMAPPQLDDLQFEHRKWSFFKSVLSTHVMGFEFLDEASRRWSDLPIGLYATCVGSTKTKAMMSPEMPLIMRLMGKFGTTADKSARNAIRVLTEPQPPARAGRFSNPKAYKIEPFAVPADEAGRLWSITTQLAADRGLDLP